MKIDDKLIAQIKSEIDKGYIIKPKHPDFDLYVLNYSSIATIEWRWNEATKFCRGLIVDGQYNIINRSYYKFFDIEQIESTKCDDQWSMHSTEKYKIAHKKDGFLGVMYVNKDPGQIQYDCIKLKSSDMAIASRGSFISDMAIRATSILHTKYNDILWNPKYTYVFEIIYPNGVLTLHYGYEDIVLHGIFDNETGKEIWIENHEDYEYFKSMGLSMECPVEEGFNFKGIEDFYSKFKFNDDEGYVISFESGYKIKVKMDEYKKLCRAKRSFGALYSKSFVTKVFDGSIDTVLNDNPNLNNEIRIKTVNEVKEFKNLLDEKYHEYNNITINKVQDSGLDLNNKNFVAKARELYTKDAGMLIALYTGNKKYEKWLIDITIDHFASYVT